MADGPAEEQDSRQDAQRVQPTPTPPPTARPAPAPLTAKEKAAARRRRILEAGRSRMDVVSGEAAAHRPTPSSASSDAPEEGEGEATEESGGGGGGGAAAASAAAEGGTGADDGGDGLERKSSSSRLAAMRRRRFRKSTAPASTPAPAPVAEDKKEEEEDKSSPEEGDKITEGEGSSGAETSTKDERETTGGEGGGGEKKKYVGVAKMRRMRLAEKKKREEEEAEAGVEASASGGGGQKKPIAPSLSTVSRTAARRSRGPLLLHFLSAVAIFLGGMALGLRGGGPGMVVTEGLAPMTEGLGALRALGLLAGGSVSGGGGDGLGGTGDEATMDARERLLHEQGGSAAQEHAAGEFDDEEFAEKPKGADGDSKKEPNIDPLFQVDLDEFTSGPGFFMAAGRFAVSVHRFNLWLLYYLPLSILSSLLALPRSLLGSPPFLFLLAVIVRAFGRDVLGAKLPDPDSSSDGGGKDEKEGETKDVLSLAANAAKNFVIRTFPTATAVWRVVRDARADMYVALCGVFVGLVLPTKIGMPTPAAGASRIKGAEEL